MHAVATCTLHARITREPAACSCPCVRPMLYAAQVITWTTQCAALSGYLYLRAPSLGLRRRAVLWVEVRVRAARASPLTYKASEGTSPPRKPTEAHGSPWKPMEAHESPWKPMEAHGSPWKPMEARAFARAAPPRLSRSSRAACTRARVRASRCISQAAGWEAWGGYLSLGVPAMLQLCSDAWIWDLCALLTGFIGPVALAAEVDTMNFVWVWCVPVVRSHDLPCSPTNSHALPGSCPSSASRRPPPRSWATTSVPTSRTMRAACCGRASSSTSPSGRSRP